MARKTRNPATQHRDARLVLLNKPYGIVSQFSGPGDSLALLVPIKGVYPAGRLDKDSEGLLLLTDQGWLQHLISHPKKKMRKTYRVQVEGIIGQEQLAQLTSGVLLKDGPANAHTAIAIAEPANLWPRDPPIRKRLNQPTSWLELTISEGRNRQVRRMTAALGFPTLRLVRSQIGPWSIANIEPGEFREIRVGNEALGKFSNL